MPDLVLVAEELEKVRLSEKEAAGAMYKAGLDVEFLDVPSIEREGTILSVDPVAGTRLRQGALITITRSNGVAPIIPDWRGVSRFDIADVITAFNLEQGLQLGWAVEEVETTAAPFWGTVIATDPTAGVLPSLDTTVVFFVAVPPVDGT